MREGSTPTPPLSCVICPMSHVTSHTSLFYSSSSSFFIYFFPYIGVKLLSGGSGIKGDTPHIFGYAWQCIQCATMCTSYFINILCTQNTVLAGNLRIQCLISSFVPVHFSCHAKGDPKFHNLNEKPVSCSTMSSLFFPCMVMHYLQQNKLWISVPITITLYLFRYCVFNTLYW